jgi:acyl-coenzyme A thioesterase PaaI-like protein
VAEPTTVPDGTAALADAVRRLVDAVVRTQASSEQVRTATAAVDAVTAALSEGLRDGPYSPDSSDPFRNPVSLVGGEAHPLAPPVAIEVGSDGARGRFRLGTAYEGAPGLVHGGVLSLVLDHVFGQAALAAGHGGMTLSLEISYRAPTPLHADLVADARVDTIDGRKVRLVGSICADGQRTVEAKALFYSLDRETAIALFPHLAAG